MRWLAAAFLSGWLYATLRRSRPPSRARSNRGEPRREPANEAAEAAAARVDLNQASFEELQALTGVGPVLARRIVDARPFGAVDDLRRVPGIGEAALAELAPLVEV